jgi:cytochrome c oxidase subunit 1
VPLTVALLVLTAEMLRGRQRPDAALLWSMLFLAVGGLVALGGLPGDVRVTAHYHSTVGAVTIAYMGLTYRLLGPTARRAPATLARGVQLLLYGGGVGLLVCGLFWAGLEGSARKAFESFGGEVSLASPGGLVMLGGTVAALGGVWFVSAAAWRLTGRPVAIVKIEQG